VHVARLHRVAGCARGEGALAGSGCGRPPPRGRSPPRPRFPREGLQREVELVEWPGCRGSPPPGRRSPPRWPSSRADNRRQRVPVRRTPGAAGATVMRTPRGEARACRARGSCPSPSGAKVRSRVMISTSLPASASLCAACKPRGRPASSQTSTRPPAGRPPSGCPRRHREVVPRKAAPCRQAPRGDHHESGDSAITSAPRQRVEAATPRRARRIGHAPVTITCILAPARLESGIRTCPRAGTRPSSTVTWCPRAEAPARPRGPPARATTTTAPRVPPARHVRHRQLAPRGGVVDAKRLAPPGRCGRGSRSRPRRALCTCSRPSSILRTSAGPPCAPASSPRGPRGPKPRRAAPVATSGCAPRGSWEAPPRSEIRPASRVLGRAHPLERDHPGEGRVRVDRPRIT
jgi:hypothetical protein